MGPFLVWALATVWLELNFQLYDMLSITTLIGFGRSELGLVDLSPVRKVQCW